MGSNYAVFIFNVIMAQQPQKCHHLQSSTKFPKNNQANTDWWLEIVTCKVVVTSILLQGYFPYQPAIM